MNSAILGVVMAGGESLRMGEPKALLDLRGSGEPQVSWVAGLLGRFCDHVVVSVRDNRLSQLASDIGLDIVRDDASIRGPMSGVVSALRAGGGCACLCVACDMPFVDDQTLRRLVKSRDGNAYATCYVGSDGRPEPMCCIYESHALPRLELLAEQGKLSLRRMLENEATCHIAPTNAKQLQSVDTPIKAAEARLQLGHIQADGSHASTG